VSRTRCVREAAPQGRGKIRPRIVIVGTAVLLFVTDGELNDLSPRGTAAHKIRRRATTTFRQRRRTGQRWKKERGATPLQRFETGHDACDVVLTSLGSLMGAEAGRSKLAPLPARLRRGLVVTGRLLSRNGSLGRPRIELLPSPQSRRWNGNQFPPPLLASQEVRLRFSPPSPCRTAGFASVSDRRQFRVRMRPVRSTTRPQITSMSLIMIGRRSAFALTVSGSSFHRGATAFGRNRTANHIRNRPQLQQQNQASGW